MFWSSDGKQRPQHAEPRPPAQPMASMDSLVDSESGSETGIDDVDAEFGGVSQRGAEDEPAEHAMLIPPAEAEEVADADPGCCPGCLSSTGAWFASLWSAMSLLNLVMILGFLALVVGLMVTSLNRLVIVPLTLTPAIILFAVYPMFQPPSWKASEAMREHLNQLNNLFVRSFFLAATLGFVVSLLVETLLTASFVAVLFSADAAKEARLAFAARFSGQKSSAPVGVHLTLSFATVLFVILTSYVASALVEELVKGCVVRASCCGRVANFSRPGSGRSRRFTSVACGQPDHLLTPRVTALLLVAAAAGMSTAENLVYTFEDSGSLARGVATALARSFISLPMQLVGSFLLAANLARRDFTSDESRRMSWALALVGPVLFHGTFDLLVLAAPMVLGRAGLGETWLTVINFIVSFVIVAVGAVSAGYEFSGTLDHVERERKEASLGAAHMPGGALIAAGPDAHRRASGGEGGGEVMA